MACLVLIIFIRRLAVADDGRLDVEEYIDDSFSPDLATVDVPFDRLPDVEKVAAQ